MVRLKIFYFFMTGRRNRAQTPSRFLPPRPSPPFGFLYGSKKWIAKTFSFSEQPRNSVRTSFGCWSICLWEVRACVGRRVTGSSSTLRCQHCGVAPTPTWLHEAFAETLKKLPATHKPNKLFLLKFSPSLLQKAGKFLPRFLWKAGGYAQTK